MKKFLSVICLAIVFSISLSSCKSKEERVIDQLNTLTEKVEKNSSTWDGEQWEKAMEDLEKIHQQMGDCEFTDEQLRTLGEVEGRLTTVIVSEGAKSIGKSVGSFLKGAGSYLKGFQEGVEEGSEESLEEIENYVNSALDKLMDKNSDQ